MVVRATGGQQADDFEAVMMERWLCILANCITQSTANLLVEAITQKNEIRATLAILLRKFQITP